jgi:hypothetical protein
MPTYGYTDCSCRDCFDIAIGKAGKALCHDCDDAGCESDDGECQRDDAYGLNDACDDGIDNAVLDHPALPVENMTIIETDKAVR